MELLKFWWAADLLDEFCSSRSLWAAARVPTVGRCLSGQVALACNLIPERSTSSSFTWLSIHFQLSGGFLSISLQLSLGRWAVGQIWGPLCACDLCRVTLSAAPWHISEFDQNDSFSLPVFIGKAEACRLCKTSWDSSQPRVSAQTGLCFDWLLTFWFIWLLCWTMVSGFLCCFVLLLSCFWAAGGFRGSAAGLQVLQPTSIPWLLLYHLEGRNTGTDISLCGEMKS